jgi:uncharacterized protein YihD (DUF1040 family)
VTLYVVSFCLLIWFFISGFSYYTTPYAQRPHHPLYRVFRPAGSEGLLFGIVGASMMILMLIYSVRKRTRWLGRKLSLRDLLDFHIYLGIIGPLFIVLHTSFKVQGLVAVSFWSMVAVALSGYFGRYLYLQIPRGIEGNELTLKELEQSGKELTEDLKVRFRLNDDDIARVDNLFLGFMTVHHTGFEAMIELVTDDMLRWYMKIRAKRRLARILPLPRKQFNELFEVSFRRALLNRRIVMLGHVQQFFHYWHVVHKPFAIIMYLIMSVHIGVAIWTGYGWVY